MRKMQLLLENALEELTGSRRPQYRNNDEKTPLEHACETITKHLLGERDVISRELQQQFPQLGNSTLFSTGSIGSRIASILKERIRIAPVALQHQHREITMQFMLPAVEAVCVLTYAMIADLGIGTPPSMVQKKRENVAEASTLMAGFPQELSANLKQLMALNIEHAMSGDDLSDAFITDVSTWLTMDVQGHAAEDKIQQLHYCPAREYCGDFARMIFDVLLSAYDFVYHQLSDGQNHIHPEIILNIRSEASLLRELQNMRNELVDTTHPK